MTASCYKSQETAANRSIRKRAKTRTLIFVAKRTYFLVYEQVSITGKQQQELKFRKMW
jgi:hypothetical protein